MSNMSNRIGERVTVDGDKLIIKNTYNGDKMLDDARRARDTVEHSFGSDYKCAGFVDMALLGVWLREAGVAWTDTAAVKDVMKKKLMSNEFNALRVWEGSY